MTPAEGPGSNPGRTTNFIHPIHPAAEFAAMSLRDHFAAQAMTAIVAQAGAILQHFMFNPEATKDWPEEAIKAMADQSAYARRAYEIADAMLAARANGGAK